MDILTIISRIIGVLMLVAWLIGVAVTRIAFQRKGVLTYSTIFQYCFLPLIIGLGLIISGNLLVILLLPIGWILSIFFPNFFYLIFPIVFGWVFGGKVYSLFYSETKSWHFISSVIGAVAMFSLCTVVAAIVWTPLKGDR